MIISKLVTHLQTISKEKARERRAGKERRIGRKRRRGKSGRGQKGEAPISAIEDGEMGERQKIFGKFFVTIQ